VADDRKQVKVVKSDDLFALKNFSIIKILSLQLSRFDTMIEEALDYAVNYKFHCRRVKTIEGSILK
jgi:hypothetical protein